MKIALALTIFLCSLQVQAETGLASYYAHFHHGKRMANGKPFNMYAHTVAHKTIKLGTRLRICFKSKCVTATVTDRGPHVKGRMLDLSLATAKKIGLFRQGVGIVTFRRL